MMIDALQASVSVAFILFLSVQQSHILPNNTVIKGKGSVNEDDWQITFCDTCTSETTSATVLYNLIVQQGVYLLDNSCDYCCV